MFIIIYSISNINVIAASTPSYSQLRLIHGSDSSDQSIFNDIIIIATSTGEDQYNSNGDWLNPFVYNDYGIIAYGLPSGEFYERSDGYTYKNGKKGEYKYIGESNSKPTYYMTNDRYFSGGSPGTKFMSVDDYRKINWQTQSGASATWSNLTKDQRTAIAERNFSDDDYGGPVNINGEIEGLTLYGLLGDSIRDKALVQVAPTMWSVNGSVRLRYNSTNWNTVIFQPLAPHTEVSATIKSEDVFVMEEEMDSITVPYTVSGTIKGDAVTQGMMQNLDKLIFYSNLVDKEVSLTSGSSATQKVSYEKKFSRAALKVGENPKDLSAVVNLTTKYKTDDPLRATAEKLITIIVKPKKVPPTEGVVFVRCFNYDNDTEIPELANEFTLKFGEKKAISGLPVPTGYKSCKGSYGKYYPDISSTEIPPAKKDMTPETSQEITLSQSLKVAYVYFWYQPKPGETPKPPTQINYDPIAIINHPAVAYAGDDVEIDGSKSYDSDGSIEHYYWEVPGADGSDPYNLWSNNIGDNKKGTVWYPGAGAYDIGLEVVDNGGCSGFDRSTITVIEPKPSVSIDVIAEKMKENRKITLDLSKSKSSKRFPINWNLTTWTIQPVYGTGASGDYGVRLENGTAYKNVNGIAKVYINGSWTDTGSTFNNVLCGQRTVQFQARDSGQYKITVSLSNTSLINSSIHYSNTTERVLNIVEDLAPIADFSGPENNIREFDNPMDKTLQKYGVINIMCTSKSPDGDPLGKRVWGVRYDYDNDIDQGKSEAEAFGDETTIYSYTGNEPFRSGVRLRVESATDTTAEIWTYLVGYYTESLLVYEDIPDSETIKELLVSDDFKSGYIQGW